MVLMLVVLMLMFMPNVAGFLLLDTQVAEGLVQAAESSGFHLDDRCWVPIRVGWAARGLNGQRYRLRGCQEDYRYGGDDRVV
jgi:hypothetical protein